MLDQPNTTAVEAQVHQTIAGVMAARGLAGEIQAEARLSEGLGLRSMDLAQIVLTLEDDLDTDPFQTIPITSIQTVGDLTRAYLVSLGLAERQAAPDMAAELSQARERRSRRRR